MICQCIVIKYDVGYMLKINILYYAHELSFYSELIKQVLKPREGSLNFIKLFSRSIETFMYFSVYWCDFFIH